jgi:pyruvate dehydrogenase E1 component beta subunit
MPERTISYRQAINEALHEEMERDETDIVIGEDIAGAPQSDDPAMQDAWGGVLGVTKGLIGKFGRQRVLDTPISESAIMGAAVGAAATGLRPVAELMFVGFSGVCLDQIVNQAAKLRYMFGGKARVPVVIRTTIGAGMGAAAQHSDVNYSVFAHYPGLKCVAPATPADAKGLLKAAIRDDDPVIFFENKTLYDVKGPVPDGDHIVPLGQGRVVREGSDVTVVAVSRMVHMAIEAADQLAGDGIHVEIVDPRSISPLDENLILESVRKTHRLIVMDEDTPRCSLATDIVALVATQAFDYLDAPPKAVTPPHTPVPFSPPLEQYYLPDTGALIAAVRELTLAHA